MAYSFNSVTKLGESVLLMLGCKLLNAVTPAVKTTHITLV